MTARAAGRGTYDKGYKDGWNARAEGARHMRREAKVYKGQYAIGYEHGWHDGEGRGQTLAQHQRHPSPPAPKSWESYEKEGDRLPA
jgi:hypothetical protein